nr:MAG TPA: hypothetical protein [Caudoviricetes sp.]
MDNENIIYVDADTREAVLHSNFKIGVVNDDSCHTLTFRINKASDIDLTDLTFYVNTTSSRGNGDKLDCTKEEDGQYIFVKCLLKGTLFEAKGKATINLCGRKYDSNNTIIKKWGSEDITVLVGSHTDSDKAIEERYPSVLEDLKSKINNLNITDAQINTIAAKVAAKGFYTKSEVDGLIAKIAVPTKLSQLGEDTTHRLVTDAEKQKWNNQFSGSYTDLSNKPTIPSKLSQLTEDNNHMTVTKAQRDKIDNFTGGTSITVDNALSATSTNPVQNKVITTELNKKANTTDLGVKKITHTASDTAVTINSGEYHVFPTMASLTITPGTVGTNHMFICGFEFASGSTPTVLTLKGCTLSNSDDVTKGTYEVNILGNSAIVRAR